MSSVGVGAVGMRLCATTMAGRLGWSCASKSFSTRPVLARVDLWGADFGVAMVDFEMGGGVVTHCHARSGSSTHTLTLHLNTFLLLYCTYTPVVPSVWRRARAWRWLRRLVGWLAGTVSRGVWPRSSPALPPSLQPGARTPLCFCFTLWRCRPVCDVLLAGGWAPLLDELDAHPPGRPTADGRCRGRGHVRCWIECVEGARSWLGVVSATRRLLVVRVCKI